MESRQRIIQSLIDDGLQKINPLRSYVLTHTYDETPRPLYLRAPYTFDVLNVLIAFIQFLSFDLEDVYGMDQTEVAEVLTELYGCELSQVTIRDAREIDLYLNWERWAGLAAEVQSLQVLQNERLAGMLQKYIDEWNAKEGLSV